MKILASAQIHILFNNLYKKYLHNYKASKKYRDNDISKIVGMYTGNTLPGFVSIDCFVALLSPLLENMRGPALELLEKVYQILKSVGSAIINQTFHKMLSLRDVLIVLFNEILAQCKENCEEYLNQIIDCETKVVFTKDPAYIISAHSWPESHVKHGQRPNNPNNPNMNQRNNPNAPNNPNNDNKNNPNNFNNPNNTNKNNPNNPNRFNKNLNKRNQPIQNNLNVNDDKNIQRQSNVIRNKIYTDPRNPQ